MFRLNQSNELRGRTHFAKGGKVWLFKKFSLSVIIYLMIDIEPVKSQQHSLLNTPPILYVPERNWRIFETEEVGQIIARIRAQDAENDDLVFGLEPHFHANYANPKENSGEYLAQEDLPFRIDPVNGIVYLNESLVGRAGQNFFLYITVSDGQLTAKNEVFVNILEKTNGNGSGRTPPSVSSVVQNISQFLPSFDRLPGVQSIRNQLPNKRPSNSFPFGFGINPTIYKPTTNNEAPRKDDYSNQGHLADWLNNNNNNKQLELEDYITTSSIPSASTNRIKLTPIRNTNASFVSSKNDQSKVLNTIRIIDQNNSMHDEPYKIKSPTKSMVSLMNENQIIGGSDSNTEPSSNSTTLRATLILIITTACGLFVAAAVIFLFLYRKRLCAISKTLKKKSKEEMTKKSNQSNLSSNLTDDSQNSMDMQHWNGPVAYGNRYVPWDRDQHLIQQPMEATSQFSTSANGQTLHLDLAVPRDVVGAPNVIDHLISANTSTSGGQSSKYDQWEFPRHRLKFFNILGEGAFGQVWRCEAVDIDGIDGVTIVAVKTLKENASQVEKKDLLSELEVMKSLQPHVNVVRFLGCCTDKDPVFVIIEYIIHGKLQTYLRNSRTERHYGNTDRKSNVLTSGELTSFMYQVAKGMDYLTSKGIIHRDLAARNILITDDQTCKIADFGFARDVITSKIYERKSEGKLPIRWMAIESLYDNIFSVKSDIWSFGILMWEIVTLGSTPYPGISASDVMRKVRDGYRLEKPEHCRRELYNIMYYCWSKDPNDRPNFSEVVQMLDKLLHTEMDYIELERFPDHNYYNILNLSGEKL